MASYFRQFRSSIRSAALHVGGATSKVSPGIHILAGHFITPHMFTPGHRILFTTFLDRLQNFGDLINIQDAVALVCDEKVKTSNDCLIALTFDDGFEECEYIAECLTDRRTSAAFFINSNYVGCDTNYRLEFEQRTLVKTKKPLTWDALHKIKAMGHIIGSHTLDHERLSTLSYEEQLFQLAKNKEVLERELSYDCEYFAWPYGAQSDVNADTIDISSSMHKYTFSSFGYENYRSFGGRVINRRHVEPDWPKRHLNYFLSVKKKH